MAKKKKKRPPLPSAPLDRSARASSPSLLFWQFAFWVPMWMSSAVAISVVVSIFATRVDHQTVLFSVLGALLPVLAFASRHVSFPDLGSPGKWGWLAVCAFLLVSLRIFVWGTVEAAGSIKVLLPNNLGDASLHLALVNFLSSSSSFWPSSPWFAPSSLEYPMGTDFFDAMMVVLLSRPALESIALTSLILSVPTAALLWGWSRAFGVALLLFCAPLPDLLVLIGKASEESTWKNLMLTVVAPQRGMLIALPLGLSFLIMARRLCSETPVLKAGWMTSLLLFLPLSPLPLFSIHATLALLPVAGWTAVILGRRAMVVLSAACTAAILPSAWLLGIFSRDSHLRIEQFACSAWDLSMLPCLLKNFGLLLPLLVWLLVQGCRSMLPQPSHPSSPIWSRLAAVYFPLLFLLSMLVAVSPWTWDNTKLMIWGVIGSAPFVWSEVLSRFPSWFRTFSVILLVIPGIGSLYDALKPSRHGHEIARAAEVRDATAARSSVPPGSVLAASPEYNHPWFLAGHAFFLGYEGWLWSHGLDSKDKRATLSEVLRGGPGWEEAAKKNGITHIVWSDREKKMTGLKSAPASSLWPIVFRSPHSTVYAAPDSAAESD